MVIVNTAKRLTGVYWSSALPRCYLDGVYPQAFLWCCWGNIVVVVERGRTKRGEEYLCGILDTGAGLNYRYDNNGRAHGHVFDVNLSRLF